jgi:parallel beta-helix repeat protein
VDCVAKKCGDDSFDVEGASSRLESCQAKGANDRGFAIDAVDGVDILSCKAIGNHGQGFELVDATNAEITSCLAKKSGEEGFSLVGISSGNTLTGNKATGSGTFDLADSSEGPNTFTDNQFKTVSTD